VGVRVERVLSFVQAGMTNTRRASIRGHYLGDSFDINTADTRTDKWMDRLKHLLIDTGRIYIQNEQSQLPLNLIFIYASEDRKRRVSKSFSAAFGIAEAGGFSNTQDAMRYTHPTFVELFSE